MADNYGCDAALYDFCNAEPTSSAPAYFSGSANLVCSHSTYEEQRATWPCSQGEQVIVDEGDELELSFYCPEG